MRTIDGLTARALLIAIASLGGWCASRAAATSTPRAETTATLGVDDEGLHKLLDDVRRRTTELDQRERELAQRSATLESLEQAVAESLTDLESHDAGAGSGSCRLRGGVTRIYESMRPEEAAQILDQLDDETLRVVFARMDPKQIAAILATMSRERAVAFTKTLAADPEPAPARPARQ